MAAIKPLEQASDKWVRRASVASPDYTAGVQSPRRNWDEAAKAAEGNYKQGVTAAANAGRYGKGVAAAGLEKWKRGASQKGPSRFTEGVALAKDDWSKGFGPYREAISALTLPPRGPAGSPANLQRVASIAVALRQLKERKG